MEKHVNRKSYFSKSLREEEKKKNRQAPHNLAYVVSANIALAKKHYIYCIVDIVLTSIKCVCVWKVGIATGFIISISTPRKYNFLVNHNGTVAVCLSFMFIINIVCMCRMNL